MGPAILIAHGEDKLAPRHRFAAIVLEYYFTPPVVEWESAINAAVEKRYVAVA